MAGGSLVVGLGGRDKAITEIVLIVTGESLSKGDLVNVYNDAGVTKVRKAQASTSRYAHGFVVDDVILGDSANVFFEGLNQNLSGLTPASKLYLSDTAGAVSESVPASGVTQVIGLSLSATSSTFESFDTSLAVLAGLIPADGTFIVGDGTDWVAESGATARVSIGLGNVENTALSTWAGSANITTVGVSAVTTHVGSIDHDSLLNYVPGEHFLQSAITTVGALGSGSITSGFGAIDIGSSALTAGIITATDLRRGDTNNVMVVAGGNNSNVGANLLLYGSTHATLANDIKLRASATTVYAYDNSEASHTFTGTLHATGAVTFDSTLSAGFSTFTGAGDGQVRLVRTGSADISIGVSAGEYHIYDNDDSAYRLKISTTGAWDLQGGTLSSGALTVTGTGSISGQLTSTYTGAVSFLATSPTTGPSSIQVGNTGGSVYIGKEDSTGSFFTGASAYESVVYSVSRTLNLIATNSPVKISPGGTTALTLSNSTLLATFAGAATITGDLTVDTNTFFVDSTNNAIGIGTTDIEAWGGTSIALEFAQSALMGDTSGQFIALLSNAYFDGAYKYKATLPASRYYQNSGTHVWATAASGTANTALTWAEAMRITNGGNVLIGTTTDSGYKLDVNGTFRSKGVSVAHVAKTAAYTTTTADEVISCDATTAAFTVTLITASGNEGLKQTIKKVDASANAVTIDGNGAETIDGSATVALASQWNFKTVMSNGTNWIVISTG